MRIADLSNNAREQNTWQILLVDDDEDDYVLILDMLSNAQECKVKLEWASSFQAGIDALETGVFDAVLMNYDLGAHSGVELIRELVTRKYPAPILLLSGRGHPEADIEALRAGAADYLHKDELNPSFLERSIRYAIERRRAEEDLRLSEARFNKAFNADPIALVISRLEDGLIHAVNPSFEHLFGYSQAEVIGKTSHEFNMFAHPSDREEAVKRLQADQSLRDFEIDIRTKSGEIRQACLTVEMITIDQDVFILTNIQDITDRKRAEKDLQEAHDRAAWLARFPDENPNPVARVSTDGHVLYCNQAARELSGWPCNADQPIPDPVFPLIKQVVATGSQVEQDVQLGDRVFSFSVMPFLSEQYVNMYGRDVTHRKQAEERLAEQARMLELVHDAIIATDSQMKVTFWNQAAEQLYGWTAEEALRQDATQLLRSGLTGLERERVLKQTHEKGVFQGEILHHAKDGRRLVIESRTSVQKDPSGQVVGYLSANRDVTERRQAEDTLREKSEVLRQSEEKYRALFTSVKEGFTLNQAIYDNSGKLVDLLVLEANQAAEYANSLRREDFVGKTWRQLWPGAEEYWWDICSPVILKGEQVTFENYAAIHKRWYEVHHFSAGQDLMGSIFLDITDRKQAEVLQQAEIEIHRIIHSTFEPAEILHRAVSAGAKALGSDTAAVSLRKDGHWLVNTVVGLSEDVIGMEMDDTQELHALLAIQTKQPVAVNDAFHDERFNREHLRKWSIHSVLVVPVLLRNEAIGVMFFNYQQSVFEFKQIHIDFGIRLAASLSLALENSQLYQNLKDEINERKRVEAILRESEVRERDRAAELETLMDAVPAMIWISRDPECRVMIGNRGSYGFLQVNPGTNISKTASDAVQANQHYQFMRDGRPIPAAELPMQVAAAMGKAARDYLFDLVFDDGTSYQLLGNVNPLFGPDGKPAGAIGAFIDITEQRRLETEQREHATQMEIQRRLMEYREKERQMIARDLHDGPVQDLSSLLFNAQFAKEAITDPGIKIEIEQIVLALKKTVQNLREMMNELRPPSLVRFGLAKALKLQLEDFREKHPEIELETNLMNDGDCLSEQIRLNLYRIVQEALNNAAKHSNATKVSLQFNCTDHQADLEIHDNGKGFSLSSDFIDYTLQNQYGLAGMRERAEAIGGTLEIRSEPMSGTTVRVIVPM